MQYPSDWLKEEEDDIGFVSILGSTFNSSVRFSKYPYSPISVQFLAQIENLPSERISSISADKYANEQIRLYQNQNDFNLLESHASSLGGNPAHKLVYTAKYIDDTNPSLQTPYITTDIISIKNGKVYFISYTAESQQLSQFFPTIQKMIDSFEIISVLPDNFLAYQNPIFGVGIQYPADWDIDEEEGDEEVASFTSPSESATITIEISLGQNVTLDEYLNDSMGSKRSYGSGFGFKVNESTTNVTLAGNYPAYKLVTSTDLTKTMQIGTIIGDKKYLISYDAPVSRYSSYLPIIQKMIDSFEIISVLPDNFLAYQNPIFGVGIQYPADWDIDEGPEINNRITKIVNLSSEKDGESLLENIQIELNNLPSSNETLEGYLDKINDSYKQIYKNYRPIESDINSILAGRTAYRLVYIYTEEDVSKRESVNVKTSEIGTIIDDKVYYIKYVAREGSYLDLKSVAERMVDSFKISNITNYTTSLSQSQHGIAENRSMAETSNNFLKYYDSKYSAPAYIPQNYGIGIQYPADWIKQKSTDDSQDCLAEVVTFITPSKDGKFTIYVQYNDPGEFESLEDDLEWYLSYVYPQGSEKGEKKEDFKVIRSSVDSTLAGSVAYELEYLQNVGIYNWRGLQIGTETDGDVYFITFDAKTSRYSSYLPIIQKMIDSFEIVEPKVTETKYLSPYENFDYGVAKKIAHIKCFGVGVPK
jgi:hypothetical protein